MTIKKFQADNEQDAIRMAKEELGSNAIVMNIKTSKPKGLFKSLRKTIVEVTAAVEENATNSSKEVNAKTTSDESKDKAKQMIQEMIEQRNKQNKEEKPIVEKPSSAIEEKLDSLTNLLEQQMEQEKEVSIDKVEKEDDKNSLQLKELVYQQLVNNEVDPEYAKVMMEDLDYLAQCENPVDRVLANVYQKVVLKLGQISPIQLDEKKPRVCFFIGATGVGKTTTIAKIASIYKIEKKAKVALLTSDTYRIAAVEQLKTYANILSIPIRVIYSPKELKKAVDDYKNYDLLLVDTAGRSHKNKKQKDELNQLLDMVPDELKEVFLVLSATTKYKDLQQTVEAYKDMANYKLAFTKLDETSCYGNILNIRMMTNAPLSYTTCGQVVPDDLGMLDAQSIAKQLLGRCD